MPAAREYDGNDRDGDRRANHEQAREAEKPKVDHGLTSGDDLNQGPRRSRAEYKVDHGDLTSGDDRMADRAISGTIPPCRREK